MKRHFCASESFHLELSPIYSRLVYDFSGLNVDPPTISKNENNFNAQLCVCFQNLDELPFLISNHPIDSSKSAINIQELININ